MPLMNDGIVKVPSRYAVDETVERLRSLLLERNITLFAVVDHSGEAAKAGLSMPNTKLLVFGNPKAGTPLMLSAPSIAIDLPLKILVAQNASGQTVICYNSTQFLAERHGLSTDALKSLSVVEVLAGAAAQ